MQYSIIIPARYASVRFPGKPLADLNGKPVIQHVYEQAKRVLDKVFIATDDHRILDAVKVFGGNALLTSSAHQSGTDRCAEAARMLKDTGMVVDVIINLQGDEPFIQPEQLELLISCFKDDSVQIATLANPASDDRDIYDPNIVKVIRAKDHRAIYFSRSPIPFIRNAGQEKLALEYPFLKHIGIYAYRYAVLQEITRLEPSPLERAESLEQLRWLENGYRIFVRVTDIENIGIDTPEDLEKARASLSGKF
jgi:3-deoxy-manno-octulosonate cytidylyltransferase (CMP-KDO synthetase)